MKYKKLIIAFIIGLISIFIVISCSGGGGGGTSSSDTESPTTPENLVATVVSSSEISLSWNQSSDNVGVVGYIVYRQGIPIANISAVSYSDKSLNPATEYCYAVSSYDAASNESALSVEVCATTNALPDTVPPTVSSTLPVNGSTDEFISTSVTVTFSEAMDPATINEASFTLKDSSNSPVAGTVSYSGLTATFTPVSDLGYALSYTATIIASATDLAGNAMLNDYSWTFTTVDAPDFTPPTVLSTSPNNGEIDVSVNTAVSATFSENMNPTTVNSTTFTLKDSLNNPVVGTVNYTGTTATFTPTSAFTSSTVYTATITTGVEDLAGNAMSQDYVWTFTTGIAADTTPPTVFSTTPFDGATDISTTSTVSTTFSEAIDPATLDTSTFYVRYGAYGAFFSGTVSYANPIATFTPVGLPYDSLLTATVTTDVKDLAGNPMASDYTWSFTTANAPQASLDISFGTNGKVITDVIGPIDFAGDEVRDLIIQSDGKIVAAGTCYNGSSYTNDFCLARYENNGVLDSNYGVDGIVITDLNGTDYLYGALVQTDGKIVVAGYSCKLGDCDISLARYSTDGTLDTTFGLNGNGKVTTNFGGNEYIPDVALLSDGKIMVVGITSGTPSGTFLARFTSAGLLDATFGTSGIIIDSTSPQMTYVRGLSIQSDGKIVVGGSAGTTGGDFMLVRYTASGILDSTFNSDGKAFADFGGTDHAEAITIAPDGKIIIAGWSLSTNYYNFALARYNTNGSLDTTFDSDGKVTTDFEGVSSASSYAISVQADGKIIAVGTISYLNDNDKPRDFALARYDNNGTLDVTFGENGLSAVDFNNSTDAGYALSIQSDGKIVVAGRSDADFALVRLLAQ